MENSLRYVSSSRRDLRWHKKKRNLLIKALKIQAFKTAYLNWQTIKAYRIFVHRIAPIERFEFSAIRQEPSQTLTD